MVLQLLLGTLLGVLAGLVSWWIVTRVLRPKIGVSAKISRVPETRHAPTWRYRIKVINVKRWALARKPLVDVKIVVTLRIRGLEPPSTKWINYNVPTSNGGVIPLIASNSVVRLRTNEIDLAAHPVLAAHIPDGDPDGLDLERLLRLGTETELRFMVTGSNPYTHSTTTEIAHYTRDHVVRGPFCKGKGRELEDRARTRFGSRRGGGGGYRSQRGGTPRGSERLRGRPFIGRQLAVLVVNCV